MKTRILCILLMSAFAGLGPACGGGQAEATQPSNPPAASADVDAASTASPVHADTASPMASTDAGGDAAATNAASATATLAGPPGPGEWDQWSHEQKLGYMKTTVMPKMGALFHDYDAKKFGEPKCTLCHGAGAKDGSFKMPNADLPKLDLSPSGFKKMHAKLPGMVDFMAKQVEPTMAQLLGMQPYDMKTQKGFGCLDCHTKVGK